MQSMERKNDATELPGMERAGNPGWAVTEVRGKLRKPYLNL
jgi:hypothetical protein